MCVEIKVCKITDNFAKNSNIISKIYLSLPNFYKKLLNKRLWELPKKLFNLIKFRRL